MAKPNKKLIAACEACLVHARDLVESAKLVQVSRRANIAYHLATLALEEMGRRELFQIHDAASSVGEIPSWQMNATQDHVQKLFWCLYGLGRVQDIIDQKQFFEKRDAAADIHAIRLSGLYVENADSGLNIPSKAISTKQSESLISLAELLVTQAESEKPRETISQEDIDLQVWFLRAFDDPDKRKRILTSKSFEKLKSLNDVAAWTRQLKAEIEKDDAELRALAEKEINRSPASLGKGDKDRWKVQLKIRTSSNSIRPKPLKKWNEGSEWIKFRPQQGALSKEELLVEITLGDNVHIGSLLPLASHIAFHLIVAINMATSGFWWWPLAPNRERIYEKIQDLENKDKGVELEDPSFNICPRRRELTDVHMQNLTLCFVALPGPNDQHRAPAYTHYVGGLNFMALNSVQWRCEGQAFGNFLESLRLLMVEAKYVNDGESIDVAAGRFLKEKYPDLDPPAHEAFVRLISAFDRRQGARVAKLPDVYLIKLLCETIFRDAIMPSVLRNKSHRGIEEGDPVEPG
jgi:AbiV family abortive infection protein